MVQKEAAIVLSPVAREHVIVHATAAIHEDENLGAATYARNLRLWFAQPGKGNHRAEYRHRREDSPQPTCDLTEGILR